MAIGLGGFWDFWYRPFYMQGWSPDEIRAALHYSQFWFPVRISSGVQATLAHLAQIKGAKAFDVSDRAVLITAITNGLAKRLSP